MPHQASVYEKIVSDVLAGRAPVYKDYATNKFSAACGTTGRSLPSLRNMPDMQQSWSVRLILKSERRFGLPARRRYPGT